MHLPEQNGPRILALWSAPRCRSTAFMRMMAERGDFLVVHEPFSHLADFGVAEAGPLRAHSEAELIAALRELSEQRPVFFKDTTDFHYPGLLADSAFLAEATHTFIIRHPREAIASHFALNPSLGRDEIGFARLAEIYDAVEATGREPVVVDSGLLMERPADTVAAYCAGVGIAYREEALSWQPGMREEWRRTQRWHESTSRTDGFHKEASPYGTTPDNDETLAEYLRFHLPFYEKLLSRRMTLHP
ncbi:hypothetical protein EDD93_3979 [Streptomyces sp. 840.1]|uniref:sulfotransferase-like domain-containing protein n=1 Tax=Streptomyces sp. 840.1 TaxID=2485152 RepID=UPI000FA4D27B|nr:sulfotransferase family protein [Streptomyces sp. 840.1]ROQ69478.1 hypothetical protein EDD93_3979 [Streptomyces sp. 840.1]